MLISILQPTSSHSIFSINRHYLHVSKIKHFLRSRTPPKCNSHQPLTSQNSLKSQTHKIYSTTPASYPPPTRPVNYPAFFPPKIPISHYYWHHTHTPAYAWASRCQLFYQREPESESPLLAAPVNAC